MLKLDLKQIMNCIDHCLKEKIKKNNWINKRWARHKIMTKFVWIRAKACSHLIDDGREDKKPEGRNKCVIKRKLKFEN